MSLSARRPYLKLKDSIVDFFKEPTRYLKETIMVESAFEKPYWDGEYQMMHLDLPTPDWPEGGYDGGPGQGGDPRKYPVRLCPGCALYADPTSDCDFPVEIHAGIFCTNTPQAATDTILKAIKDERNPTVVAGDSKLEVFAQVGAISSVNIGEWAMLGPSASVYVDKNIPKHTICGIMTDGAGNQCMACVDVECACSCDDNVMTIDAANTDLTIAAGGTAAVAVTEGCPPYTWSISGLGYSIVPLGESVSQTATVTCAAGACITNYTDSCVVTVVDQCRSVNTTIKNTSGDFCLTGQSFSNYPSQSCNNVYNNCTLWGYHYYPVTGYTSGTKYWQFSPANRCIIVGTAGLSVWDPAFLGIFETPPCGIPESCDALFPDRACVCDGNPDVCYSVSCQVMQWRCPGHPDCV